MIDTPWRYTRKSLFWEEGLQSNHHHPLLLGPRWEHTPRLSISALTWLETQGIHIFRGNRQRFKRSDTLGLLGIRGWYPAVHGIPRLVKGQEVYLEIDRYLKQVSPTARNFKNPWRIKGTPLPAPEMLHISFEQLVTNIRSALH